VSNPRIRQISQGFTGNSFNTLEFFHRVPAGRMRAILVAFIALAFIVPVILVAAALAIRSPGMLWVACVAQFGGLILERWFFLADSNHPQNLYYQNRA
jgi:DMSO reductase anchor subunit